MPLTVSNGNESGQHHQSEPDALRYAKPGCRVELGRSVIRSKMCRPEEKADPLRNDPNYTQHFDLEADAAEDERTVVANSLSEKNIQCRHQERRAHHKKMLGRKPCPNPGPERPVALNQSVTGQT